MADDVSLKEHFDQRFEDLDRRLSEARLADEKRTQLALTANKEAVDKAEQANERRLGLLNEFRGQAAEESRKYVPRETYDLAIGQLQAKVAGFDTVVASLQGRALALAGFGALIGGAAVAVFMRFLGS